jgi:hypothetical protein
MFSDSGRELPRVPDLQPFYDWGVRARRGEVIMIAGRSGMQKSGFALWWTGSMSKLAGTSVLYFSADMSRFTASARLASMFTGYTTEEVEEKMAEGGEGANTILEALAGLRMQFSFDPLTWPNVEDELDGYVEVWDADPDVIVFDNLMDFQDAEADYALQMAVMSNLTDLARETGSAVVVLHHATDKSSDARSAPGEPGPRSDIKNGMAEKPAEIWMVALESEGFDAHGRKLFAFRLARVKGRMGPSDPSGRRYVTIYAQPEITRFHAHM